MKKLVLLVSSIIVLSGCETVDYITSGGHPLQAGSYEDAEANCPNGYEVEKTPEETRYGSLLYRCK
ncbi:MAG: hypothetical protein LBE24_04800 [Methylobacillus sp.]|jgi:uncharacterized protein YceK|nr:hypothetical protein [Methylobacillus sp.]